MHLNVSKIRRKKKKKRKLTEVENKKNFEIKSTDAIKKKKKLKQILISVKMNITVLNQSP